MNFEIGERIVLHSPYTGEDFEAEYRGGDGVNVFIYNPRTGWQGSISASWVMGRVSDFENPESFQGKGDSDEST